MLVRLINTTDSNVCIDKSTFVDNSAEVNGGALHLSAVNGSSYNTFTFHKTNFSNNNCTVDSGTSTGGAISINYFRNSVLNQIHFHSCQFENNTAYSGGALALLTNVGTEPDEDSIKPLYFFDCLFHHNRATKDGSALSVFSVALINESVLPIFFEGW